MKSEQAAFGERLREALRQAGMPESPTAVAKQLPRHGGEPVSTQAVHSWIRGKAMPRSRNLKALARLLQVTPEQLYAGDAGGGRRVRESRVEWAVGAVDRRAIDAFVSLEERHRRLVRDLILALSERQDTQG